MKIVPFRASSAEADDMKLCSNMAVLDMTLEQIADQAPELRAIGWVVDGNCGGAQPAHLRLVDGLLHAGGDWRARERSQKHR